MFALGFLTIDKNISFRSNTSITIKDAADGRLLYEDCVVNLFFYNLVAEENN